MQFAKALLQPGVDHWVMLLVLQLQRLGALLLDLDGQRAMQDVNPFAQDYQVQLLPCVMQVVNQLVLQYYLHRRHKHFSVIL